LYIAFAGEKRMPTQNLRVGFSATATSVGERGDDISLTSFSRHSLATTPAKNLITDGAGAATTSQYRDRLRLDGHG
jgi:hypothetical protein